MGSNRWLRNSLVYLLIILGVIVIFFTLIPTFGASNELALTEVIAKAKSQEIAEISVRHIGPLDNRRHLLKEAMRVNIDDRRALPTDEYFLASLRKRVQRTAHQRQARRRTSSP